MLINYYKMTSELTSVYKWETILDEAARAERVASQNVTKANRKIALRNGEGLAELYERLIKAGDELTKWTTIVAQDPQPGWIEKKEEAIAIEKATREEWDSAHKEAAKASEELNLKSTEYYQLKKDYTAWIEEMQKKREELYKKELIRQQTKKID